MPDKMTGYTLLAYPAFFVVPRNSRMMFHFKGKEL